MLLCVINLCAWATLLGLGAAVAVIDPYDLDVVPRNLPVLVPDTKHVPRKIWMAVKDIKDELPGHIQAFLKRNSQWEANVCDNDCKDKFMNSTFAGNEGHGVQEIFIDPDLISFSFEI